MTFKETILQEALELFQSEGIESLSEQDIMTRLDISNATYHELFKDKKDLVKQVIQHDHEVQKRKHQEIAAQTTNAVDEILTILMRGIEDLKRMDPSYITDLLQHYPEAWNIAMTNLYSYTYHHIFEIINKGVVSGHFRKDLNIAIVTKIMLEQLNMMVNPAIFQPDRYDLAEVFRSIYLYYVRGICTEQGGKLADDFFSRNKLV